MNYLWEVLLQAKAQGVEENKIRFLPAAVASPYMELSDIYLNLSRLDEPYEIYINPYYRFLNIFYQMFHPDEKEFDDLRKGLFQLIVHQLGENDICAGMTKNEYYKKMLAKTFSREIWGKSMADSLDLLGGNEKDLFLDGLLTLYQEGESLKLFKIMMAALFPTCIVYESNDDPLTILIYIGRKKTEVLEQKIELILRSFLGLRYHVELYFEYHFGIMGMKNTMRIGEIAIF